MNVTPENASKWRRTWQASSARPYHEASGGGVRHEGVVIPLAEVDSRVAARHLEYHGSDPLREGSLGAGAHGLKGKLNSAS